MTALLSVRNFSVLFKRGAGELFRNVSFEVLPGEVAVIVGDSGAGKTTLLHFVAGFARPYMRPRTTGEFLWRGVFPVPRDADIRGNVMLNGVDVTQLPPSQRDIGLVMQRFSLYPNMTARENVMVALRARKVDPDEAEKELLRIAGKLHMDFDLDSRPNQLSGGQSQRVAIGKLLARDPLLALCDEAFSNLDFKLRQTFRREVIHERKGKPKNGVQCAVLFVSHDLQDAEEADRIIYLKRTDKDAREQKPTEVHVFPRIGGNENAWAQFCRETNYHITQLVTVGTDL